MFDGIKKFSKNQMVLFWLLLMPSFVWCQEFYDLPQANCFIEGTPRSKLVVVKEILPDFDEKLFFALPMTMAVNKDSFIYLYDLKMLRIFIFDNKYKYVGQCLERGIGPGESPGPGNKEIYCSETGDLFMHDALTDRLILFNATGKFLKDIRLHRRSRSKKAFIPIVDKDGFLYTFSQDNSIVEKYDKDLTLVNSFLDIKLMDHFVYYRPAFESFYQNPNLKGLKTLKRWLIPSTFTVFYDIMAEDQLFIFLHRSTTAFIFKKNKLSGQFEILIDRVLDKYKIKVVDLIKEQKKSQPGEPLNIERPMFMSCFLDKDDPNFFYLQGNFDDPECSLYKINKKGKLVWIYSNTNKPVIFKAKRNGLFYGLSTKEYHPIVFK